MNFLYPLGLIGLIGIPILILIYIIKSKYTEQTIATTYIWNLSEKFLKRKLIKNPLTGLISLILQILTVALISLAIAHPQIVVPGAAKEYCIILDGSGSMSMVEDGTTRLELAKDEAKRVIEESVEGSLYSLVYVNEKTNVIYEREPSKEVAIALLDDVSVSHASARFEDAIGVAQEYFNENDGLVTYLITDKSFDTHNAIEIINVASEVENYALGEVSYSISNNVLTVSGSLMSYTSDADLTLAMYLDGADTPFYRETLAVKRLDEALFVASTPASVISSVRVVIENADALPLDNEYIVYDTDYENAQDTLIVSNTPFFIESALAAVGNVKITTVSPEDYDPDTIGYGLYIFDSFNPGKMPRDGAVWLINLDSSIPDSGFSVQAKNELDGIGKLSLTKSTSTTARKLIANLSGEDIYISEYIQCGTYRPFTTLFEYNGAPVIFTGTNTYGNREVVFSFDLHGSNMPMHVDFVTLVGNLVEFSFPDVVEKVNFVAGDEIEINALANCESIRVDAPSGATEYLDASTSISRYTLSEAGAYTITMTVSGTQRTYNVFASLNESERAPIKSENDASLVGEQGVGTLNGIYDALAITFILLAIVFLAEWGVYCYDKYQLR